MSAAAAAAAAAMGISPQHAQQLENAGSLHPSSHPLLPPSAYPPGARPPSVLPGRPDLLHPGALLRPPFDDPLAGAHPVSRLGILLFSVGDVPKRRHLLMIRCISSSSRPFKQCSSRSCSGNYYWIASEWQPPPQVHPTRACCRSTKSSYGKPLCLR